MPELTHVIRIGRRYFSARRGYSGGRRPRAEATLFTQSEAVERARTIPNAVAEAI